MTPKDRRKNEEDGPLENQPLEWADENREIDTSKPDLGELDEDPSEL